MIFSHPHNIHSNTPLWYWWIVISILLTLIVSTVLIASIKNNVEGVFYLHNLWIGSISDSILSIFLNNALLLTFLSRWLSTVIKLKMTKHKTITHCPMEVTCLWLYKNIYKKLLMGHLETFVLTNTL